jgi:penicillin-binding protein 2
VSRRPVPARRFGIIVSLVVSMVLTLVARLYYVQVLDPNKPHQTAGVLHDGVVVLPAPRGLIVDAQGRTLVDDRAIHLVQVDRDRLLELPDKGAAVLRRLAALLHRNPVQLSKQITPCSPSVPAPCWVGEPYEPVPVATSPPTSVVLAISEHRELYPGVTVLTRSQRHYPGNTLAAHILGYASAVTQADKKRNPTLTDSDLIGVSGLEEQYDAALRGTDGRRVVRLSPQGYPVADGSMTPAQQGLTLVTSINARLQALAQKALVTQIAALRKQGKPATSGSIVVMAPQTGRVLAVASWPTYGPQLFVGGISNKNYRALTAPSADDPLLSRAIAGQYAPGSTFKLITSSSLVMHHEISLDGRYSCPGSVAIDGRVKTNFESESFGGPISLEDALGYSCDTFFYQPAAAEYYADQRRIASGRQPHEWLQRMAASYGLGTIPGVDLPASEQAAGSYADRESRLARWRANRTTYCAEAKRGYPEIKDAADRAYLTQLAAENCTDGWRYRAGDNADMSIGQGETTMSPLQLAVAYSALVNGGRLWEPRIGWALEKPDGTVVRTMKPVVRRTVPVSSALRNYIMKSLSFRRGWSVSGAFAYLNSPYRNLLGGKTGTAEVFGHQDTAWLASWGPVYRTGAGQPRARLVMVGMIEQGGIGAFGAGPMEKQVWDGIFGVGSPTVLPGAAPATTIPRVRTDGR